MTVAGDDQAGQRSVGRPMRLDRARHRSGGLPRADDDRAAARRRRQVWRNGAVGRSGGDRGVEHSAKTSARVQTQSPPGGVGVGHGRRAPVSGGRTARRRPSNAASCVHHRGDLARWKTIRRGGVSPPLGARDARPPNERRHRPMQASTIRLSSSPRSLSSRAASPERSTASATHRQDSSHVSVVPPLAMQERWHSARNVGRSRFARDGAKTPVVATAQTRPIRIG